MDLEYDHRDPPRWWGSPAQTRDVVPWFIFNVADAAILMGIVFFACDVPAGRMFSRPRL